MGRPARTLDERLVTAARIVAEKGGTDKEIAESLGVSPRTFARWKETYPDLWRTLKESKDIADDLMEDSLYELGLAGNVTAQIFWLKNRRPERWRDVQRIDVNATHKLELPSREDALKALREDYAVTPAIEGVKDEELA